MTDLQTIISKLQEDFEATISSGTAESQKRLLAIIDELHSVVNERIQDMCREEMHKMLNRLKNGLSLAPSDVDQIRLWIIGDEHEHAKSEHHCQVWESELKEILEEIKNLRDAQEIPVDYSKFRALLRRASVVLADIFYCRQQKEKLDQFDQIGSQISPSQRAFLIKMLQEKLDSADG